MESNHIEVTDHGSLPQRETWFKDTHSPSSTVTSRIRRIAIAPAATYWIFYMLSANLIARHGRNYRVESKIGI